MRRLTQLALLAVLAVLIAHVSAAEWVLEVITLTYRNADEVLPLVQPLINQRGGTITGANNQLIVNAAHGDVGEIKRIISAIDSPPRQLVITVRTEDSTTRSRSGAEIAGNVGGRNARVIVPGSGDDSGVTIGGRKGDDSVRARVFNQESSTGGSNLQQLLVLEGNSAFISSGRSVPVQERTIIHTPKGAQIVDSVQHHETATGFYVLPRVSGDRVTLDISPRREALSGREIESQRIATQITTRLGEWVQIAGADEERASGRSGIASRESRSAEQSSTVWLKVEEVR